MTRRTERICFSAVLAVLVVYLAIDWRNRQVALSDPPTSRETLDITSTPVSSNSSSVIEDKERGRFELHLSDSPLMEDLESDPSTSMSGWNDSVEESDRSDRVYAEGESGEAWTEQQIDDYYDRLARKKSRVREPYKLVDYEKTRGEKPDWMVMAEWNNRLRLENYLDPGPIHTTSYTDRFGNRHRSFEDRSGRVDVFNTWGREEIYVQPK